MQGEISTKLRLAPQSNSDAFLLLFEVEVLALDSCVLELMNIEAASSGTPQPPGNPQPPAPPQPSGCTASEGKYAGATWDTLAAGIVHQDLADNLDREFAGLARAFRIEASSE
jgi:hypothetical protein